MLRFFSNKWIDRLEENTNMPIQMLNRVGPYHSEDEESLNEEHKHDYRDFETINWYRDITLPQKTCLGALSIKNLFYAASGWIAVTLVGLIIGAITFILTVSIKVLFESRLGFCPKNLLYNELQCNWPYEIIIMRNETVKQWITYEQHFINIGYNAKIAHGLSYLIYTVLGTLFATASALISYNIGPYAVSSGIPEVETILKGFVIHGYFGLSTVIVKIVTVVLAVASGLNVGFESSLVHIGAAIGNLVSRIFPKYRKSEAKKREILSSGAAAGISSAFNAPIGGLLFSFEEASHYFSFKTLWRTFWCTLISTLICYNLYPPFYTKILYKLEFISNFRIYELVPFIFVGIVGGIFGFIVIKIFALLCKFRKNSWLGDYPVFEVFAVSLLICLISFHFPLLKMSNYQLAYQMYGDCLYENFSNSGLCLNQNSNKLGNLPKSNISMGDIASEFRLLSMTLFFKCIFLIISFSLKIPNGFMFPIMTIGAVFGRIVGNAMKYMLIVFPDWYFFKKYCYSQGDNSSCIDIALYAVIGSSAFLAGSTHMTVTLVVIMVELIDGAGYIVPIMVSVLVAKSVSKLLTNLNIFETSCILNDYPFIDLSVTKQRYIGTAHDVIAAKKLRSRNTKIITLSLEPTKLSDIYDTLKHCYYSFPLLEGSGSMMLIGSVVAHELFKALKQLTKINDEISHSTEVLFSAKSFRDDAENINLSNLVDYSVYIVSPVIPTYNLIQLFNSLGLHCVHVTRNGIFIDIITKKDLIYYIKNCL